MTPGQRFHHYRTDAKIYGLMICEAAGDDEFITDLIEGKNLSPMLEGLRQRIENSPVYEE